MGTEVTHGLPAVLPEGAVKRLVLRFGPLPRPLPDPERGALVPPSSQLEYYHISVTPCKSVSYASRFRKHLEWVFKNRSLKNKHLRR